MMAVGEFIALARGVESLADAFLLLDLYMAANPVGLIIVAVIALIAGIVMLYKHWKWFHDAVDNTWHWIKKNWKLLAAVLLAPISPVLAAVVLLLTHLKEVKGLAKKIHDTVYPPHVKHAKANHSVVASANIDRGGGASLGVSLLGSLFGHHKDVQINPKMNPLRPVLIGPALPRPKQPGGQGKDATHLPKQVHEFNIFLDGKRVAATVNKVNADRKSHK
jgi:hypothetical protein